MSRSGDGQPTPHCYLPKGPSKAILRSQARAFLEAGEDVEIDVETVEDLMDAFIDVDGGDSDDNDIELTLDVSEQDNQGGSQLDLHDGMDDDAELDISALYQVVGGGPEQTIWSSQEIKQMMHHLKERGLTSWVREYVVVKNIPIPALLLAFGIDLCDELQSKRPSTLMYFLRVAMSRELRMREKLDHYSTIDDAVKLIKSSRRMVILTGAGISVSCGIPDFRSRDGLYAQLKNSGQYELDDPQQMFDINYFRENPNVFYSFASQIYPSNFTPSPCHRFIKLIEDKGKLLRNYTQNIDTLETLAGVKNVLQCHGSFATASCLLCRVQVPGSDIEDDILRKKVPICKMCMPSIAAEKKKLRKRGKKKASGNWDSQDEDESDSPIYPACIMKPNITFFGEKLSDAFDNALSQDRSQVDLLLVIGTSLKVSPVSELLSHLPHSIPQILINKTPVRHINPDIVLLGNADDIIHHLCYELNWELPLPTPSTPSSSGVPSSRLYPARTVPLSKKRSSAESVDKQEPRRVGNSHVWIFEGAEGGKWVEQLEREESQAESEHDDYPATEVPEPKESMVYFKTTTDHPRRTHAAPAAVLTASIPSTATAPVLSPEETARRAWKKARMN